MTGLDIYIVSYTTSTAAVILFDESGPRWDGIYATAHALYEAI